MKQIVLLLAAGLLAAQAQQLPIDPDLAYAISRIKAIDNHAHPAKVVLGNDKKDFEFDALPVDNLEPASDPVRTRPDNPQVIEAWRALFGYSYADRAPEHLKELQDRKQKLREEKGDDYANWVLDQCGTETMLANRVALGRGLRPPRFRWVPFVDALIFPLDNKKLEDNPDRKAFFPLEDRLRARYLAAAGYKALPPTLDEYLSKVVTATLERQKKEGALAAKFEVAYLRALDFGDPAKADVARIYAFGRVAGVGNADYKELQDFLFRYIATECGRLGLAVHLHSGVGGGSYYHIAGTNPMLFEPILNDPRLRKTTFVFLHGDWPFEHQLTAFLEKPNFYVDFSYQTFENYPREVSRAIREWLEHNPEKVMFATDAYPYSPEIGWEEGCWLAAKTGREALGLALTGMLHDGEIDRDEAVRLARMVLRDNARKLYNLP